MVSGDTIVAVATPPGRGGIGIIRLSGPLAAHIGAKLLGGTLPPPRHARYGPLCDQQGTPLDHGIALWFPAPHSFTGEDVVELQGHGGPVVLDMLLEACCHAGARLANAGEFSQRAFLNDRIDLAQAEAIADLIDATSRQAARSALQTLQGRFSQQIDRLVEGVITLRIHVEAAIDFPEEEIDFLADASLQQQLDTLQQQLKQLLCGAQQGQLLRDGMQLVLAGTPNVGKSSLLNALAGEEHAIVTDIPGTTRDLLRAQINLNGMPLHIIDTAGLRDTPADAVEAEGMRRSWQAIAQADRLLLVMDDRTCFDATQQALIDQLPTALPVTLLRNKIDLSGGVAGLRAGGERYPEIGLSARTGMGIDALRDHLQQVMGYHGGDGAFIARRRHLQALQQAAAALQLAAQQLTARQGELMAEELRQVQQALATITGSFDNDQLLGRIFSSFCIGK